MLLALLLASALPAGAQQATLRGQVLLGRTNGPTALADQWVVLHRVDAEGGAPLDSVRTGRDGRFRLRLTWDTTAIYFVGTEWQDIAYLTQPVPGRNPVDTLETLMVYDTTRTGPPLFNAERHLVIRSSSEQDAGRRVLELVELENRGTATRVGTGPAGPTWATALPDGAFQFEVGESDMSSEAVRAADGEVQVMAPVPPGQRQLLYTYVLPAGDRTLALTLDQPVGRMTLLLEDTLATLSIGPLTDRGVEVFEDATFRIFEGAVDSQRRLEITFSARRGLSEQTLTLLLVLAAAFGGLLLLRLRRRPAADASAPLSDDPKQLARQIAALDAAWEAHGKPDGAEGRRYRAERARLKAALDRVLGNAGPGAG